VASFLIISAGWLLFGYSEAKGNMEEFLTPALVSLLVILALFWLIKKSLLVCCFG